jgi:hypothetical protein
MKQTGRPKSYPSRFAVKLPDCLRDVLEETARKRFTTSSELVRTALLEKFEREGLIASKAA